MRRNLLFALTFLFLFAFSLPLGTAQELPDNLKLVSEYNQQESERFAADWAFFAAFLAGILSILSPCTLALLPAFVVYTVKEKKDVTKMTLIFGSGFLSSFTLLGLGAAILGKGSIVLMQDDLATYIQLAGLLLIGLGALKIVGKGFSGIPLGKRGKTIPEVFLFGFLFTLGWSACSGPILAGIIIMASTMGNYIYSTLMLLLYGVGVLVPLLLVAVLYDKYEFWKSPWVRGKELIFGEIQIHTTNLIAGLLLIGLGLLFLFHEGTASINDIDIMGLIFLFVLEVLIYLWVAKRTDNKLAKGGLAVILIGLFGWTMQRGFYTKMLWDDTGLFLYENPVFGNIAGAIMFLLVLALIILAFRGKHINKAPAKNNTGGSRRGKKTSK